MRQNHALRSLSLLWCMLSETAKEVLKRRHQKRHIVTIVFCSVYRIKFKSCCKIFKCRVSTKNLQYGFDIGDHPTPMTCLPIAAERFKRTFQVKVLMQFQCFDLFWFQSFLFSESKINISVRHHMYQEPITQSLHLP